MKLRSELNCELHLHARSACLSRYGWFEVAGRSDGQGPPLRSAMINGHVGDVDGRSGRAWLLHVDLRSPRLGQRHRRANELSQLLRVGLRWWPRPRQRYPRTSELVPAGRGLLQQRPPPMLALPSPAMEPWLTHGEAELLGAASEPGPAQHASLPLTASCACDGGLHRGIGD